MIENVEHKPFILVLDKYKDTVVVNSVKVDEHDDTLLHIDFDHDIETAPPEEVAEELGKVILKKLEEGMASFDVSGATVEVPKQK